MVQKSFDYVLARAKAVETGDEVMGYVHFTGINGRESLIYITLPHTNEVVYVDPMSVELFTGMRCAVSGERIFEGDVIRLHTMNGMTLNYHADHEHDFLCEICMPLNMCKWGAQKRLYVNRVSGISRHEMDDYFQGLAGQWDALEWEIVGRAGDKSFGSVAPSTIKVYSDQEKTEAYNIFNNGCNVWMVNYGTDWKNRELFGTFNRRKHIIRRLEENSAGQYDYKPRYKGIRAPQFNSLKSKWCRDFKKYMA